MATKNTKPVTPGQRRRSMPDFGKLSKEGPERSLLAPLKQRGGRNRQGRMTTRHQGGAHKRRYRRIDFERDKHGIPAKVARIEYDPNRTAWIALLHYADGEKRYIIAPREIEVGQEIVSGPDAPPEEGNALPLGRIPVGESVHAIELKPGRGAQLARSAGTAAEVTARESDFTTLKLPSGEVRRIPGECYATIGSTSNPDHMNVILGKAGRNRWKGVRPKTRGVAMNPIDHPMGGGEGAKSGGHPRSPWGQGSKGLKTRKRNKESDVYIVRRRNQKKK